MTTRLARANAQRLFLVKKPSVTDTTFHVLGTTNTSYIVDFLTTDQPSCTCMDFRLRKRCCKHILFVLIRVLGIPVQSEQCTPEVLLPAVRKIVKVITGEYNISVGTVIESGSTIVPEASTVVSVPQRAYAEDDECPICFDPFGKELLVYCTQVCGNSVHQVCFDMWKRKQGKTCVMCRAKM